MRFIEKKDSALSQPCRDPPTPLKASGGCYLWKQWFLFMGTKASHSWPQGPTHPQDSALSFSSMKRSPIEVFSADCTIEVLSADCTIEVLSADCTIIR